MKKTCAWGHMFRKWHFRHHDCLQSHGWYYDLSKVLLPLSWLSTAFPQWTKRARVPHFYLCGGGEVGGIRGVYAWAYVHIPHVCRSLWRPEEGVEYPGTRVADDCEPPNVRTGKQTQIIFKKIKTIKHWVTSQSQSHILNRECILSNSFIISCDPKLFKELVETSDTVRQSTEKRPHSMLLLSHDLRQVITFQFTGRSLVLCTLIILEATYPKKIIARISYT